MKPCALVWAPEFEILSAMTCQVVLMPEGCGWRVELPLTHLPETHGPPKLFSKEHAHPQASTPLPAAWPTSLAAP